MNEHVITLESKTNSLRTECCFAFVCNALNIPMNGNSIGKTFSTEKNNYARSGKFTKLLKGKSIPSQETVLKMDEKVPGVAQLFYSPIWYAIFCIERNIKPVYFNALDPNVQHLIFKAQLNRLGKFELKTITASLIKKVFELNSLSSLACLLLLRHSFDRSTYQIRRVQLDKPISDSFVNLSVISELPSWLSNIWNEIQEWHIKNTSSNVEPYRVDSSSLEQYANFQDTLLYWFISKIIPMGVNIKEESKLLTLFSQANSALLYKELRA